MIGVASFYHHYQERRRGRGFEVRGWRLRDMFWLRRELETWGLCVRKLWSSSCCVDVWLNGSFDWAGSEFIG